MPCSSYNFLIHTIVLLLLLLPCFRFSVAASNDTERLALLEIKSKISDPLGALNSWNDSIQLCDWYGVTCGVMHGRVTELDLHSLKLSGSISPSIGNLSFLRELQLQNNSFGGIIPPEIGRLHRLQRLWIFNNSIAGEIPVNISGCYSLIYMSVDRNKLVGSVPDALGSLQNLRNLSLSHNNLVGNIPSSLGNLSSLNYLSLTNNQLTGNIPNSFGKLKKLTSLTLGLNMLSGLVPSSIFNLSRLTLLDLGFNRLQGSLPSDIGVRLPLLNIFSVMNNSLTGVIPSSLSNLSSLRVLQLGSNRFRGQVPSLKKLVNLRILRLGNNTLGIGQTDDLGFISSLQNATMLYEIDINQNNFSGILPNVICNFSSIAFLYLDMNKIGGKIPTCVDNLANLQLLNIKNNLFSGIIPYNIGKLQNLIGLILSYNQLSGYIPPSLGNLTNLDCLFLDNNNLVGQIPLSMGNNANLLRMDLSYNNLNGSIPPQILGLSFGAIVLYLNNNQFTGHLNNEFDQLKNLFVLDVSSNMLSGEIPTSLSSCVELQFLYMQDNVFEGTIPDALQTLTSLQELNLSQNNLSGKIPEFLVTLPLEILNLSYNNFEGDVPTGGVFGNVTGISITGNDMLCGGIHVLNRPICPTVKTRVKRKKLILALIFVVLSFIMLVTFVLVCLFWYRRKAEKIKNDEVTSKSLLNLSHKDLVKATNGFSSENLIGSGSFGVVYKGILDPDETVVAIKVFKLEHRGASKSFMAECGVLRNIRHRNLVRVITACSSNDYQGNDFKALVYKYMINGNLEEWLYPNNADRSLSFLQRLDIVVDVAFAISYLHCDYGTSIVHCDLKPSNILLDEDMVAHVGDFGLAKFLATSQAVQSNSLGLRGTVGYAPPEYGLGNEVSTSGDIYSFGILLMEIITGKKPTLDMFKDGLTLPNLVQAAFPDKVTEIIDTTLLEEINEENENKKWTRMMLEASISVLGLALSCCAELPYERLDMKEVASELSAIKNRFTETKHRLYDQNQRV